MRPVGMILPWAVAIISTLPKHAHISAKAKNRIIVAAIVRLAGDGGCSTISRAASYQLSEVQFSNSTIWTPQYVAQLASNSIYVDNLGGQIIDADEGDSIYVAGNGMWGDGDIINVSGGKVLLAADTRADLYGDDNSITTNDFDTIGAYGTNNVITIGNGCSAFLGSDGGNTINIVGGGSVVYDDATSGDTINVSGNGIWGDGDIINMSGGTVVFSVNSRADVYGNNNAITAANFDTVGVYGTENTITIGSASSVWLGSDGGNVVNINGGASVVYNESTIGDIINVSGNGIWGDDNIINMSGGTVVLAADTRADVFGNDNVITTNDYDTIGAYGTGNTISIGNGSFVFLGSQSGNVVNIDGGGNYVYADSGEGNAINISGNGIWGETDVVTMSGGTVILTEDAHADVYGNNNTITAGDEDTVGATGTENVITIGGGGSVWLGLDGGNTVNIVGGGTVVYDDSINGDIVTISGNGQHGVTDTVNMSYGLIFLDDDTNLTVSGIENNIYVGQNDKITNMGGDPNFYVFQDAFGQGIIDNGAGSSAKGEISFSWSVTNDDIWFSRSGNDLEIDLMGTSNQITVSGWYSSSGNQVQSIQAYDQSSDEMTLDSQIEQLVSAMAVYSANNPGFNPDLASSMPTDTALQNAIAAAWHS